jgi:hypothetical protein
MSTGHPYLRRRVRPGPTAAPTSTASAATPQLAPPSGSPASSTGGTAGGSGSSSSSLSLSFGRPAAPSPTPAVPTHSGTAVSGPAAPASRATTVAPVHAGSRTPSTAPTDRVARRLAARAARIRPFPAPDPQDVRVLGPDHPVVRIDRRRSAVGALRVTGATSAAWETTDWTVGAETVDGAEAGRSFRTAGNRPLVGFDGGAVLVALRHVRQLRRALVMGRGADRLVVALHDGTTLAVDPGDADTMTVLALSVVDGELELRAEPFPRSSHDGEVFAAFGFVLSAPTGGV